MSVTLFDSRGVSGIYCAIHRDTGACYVGSSVDINRRLTQHLGDAVRNAVTRFHLAINQYGREAFDFEILEECDKAKLLERERFYIALMGAATVDGFNTEENPTKPRTGTGHSEVTKQRIGAANRGRIRTPEHRAKISAFMRGRKMPPEAVAKTKAAHLGRKHSPESRARMSEAAKGRKFSAEHRQKISAFHLGRKRSAETCAKIGDVHRGRKRPASTCAKMSEFQRGRIRKPHSAETRAKMSAATKGRKKSPEQIAKMRQYRVTEETRARICAAQQARWARVRAEKELTAAA